MLEKILNLLNNRLQQFMYDLIVVETIHKANYVVDNVAKDIVETFDRKELLEFIVEFENRNDMNKTGSVCYFDEGSLCVDPVQVVKTIKNFLI